MFVILIARVTVIRYATARVDRNIIVNVALSGMVLRNKAWKGSDVK